MLEQWMDDRFAKLEHAMEPMAEVVVAPARKKLKKKKNKSKEPEVAPPSKKSHKSKKAATETSLDQRPIHQEDELQEIIDEHHLVRQSSKVVPPSTTTVGLSDVRSADLNSCSTTLHGLHSTVTPPTHQNNMGAPMPAPDVKKIDVNRPDDWCEWLMLEPNVHRPTTVGELQLHNDVQAHVKSILQDTATHMSKGNNIKNFPFEYVLHGTKNAIHQ